MNGARVGGAPRARGEPSFLRLPLRTRLAVLVVVLASSRRRLGRRVFVALGTLSVARLAVARARVVVAVARLRRQRAERVRERLLGDDLLRARAHLARRVQGVGARLLARHRRASRLRRGIAVPEVHRGHGPRPPADRPDPRRGRQARAWAVSLFVRDTDKEMGVSPGGRTLDLIWHLGEKVFRADDRRYAQSRFVPRQHNTPRHRDPGSIRSRPPSHVHAAPPRPRALPTRHERFVPGSPSLQGRGQQKLPSR